MSDEQEEYLAVLKASYDYTPQSEDEIEIKEDQLLLLIEKTDDECVVPHAAQCIANYL
jgi:actin cytoskeleton-regulatory complex protein SLA1